MDAIRIEKLTKSFGKQEVLTGINLTVAQGEIFTLLGENGAGKSTLINILTTLSQATGGDAWILGKDIRAHSDEIRELISMMGQSVTLDDEFTGYENMKLIAKLRNLKEIDQRIDSVAKRLHLTDFIHRKVGTYSGGMKRRLDIAVSLLANTEVLFLDEPTTGVDPKNRLEIWQLIMELKNEGKTIFLTTQYLEEADRLSDTIGFIHDGRIVLKGTPEQLKHHARDLYKILIGPAQGELAETTLAQSKIGFQKADGGFNVAGSSLQRALLQLLESNIEIREASPIELSLEEVFMEVTGKEASS